MSEFIKLKIFCRKNCAGFFRRKYSKYKKWVSKFRKTFK